MTLWRSNARPPTEVALVKVAGGGGGGFVDALLKPFHISPKVIKKTNQCIPVWNSVVTEFLKESLS